MKKIFLFGIITLIIFSSCQKKDNNQLEQKEISRIVSLGASATEILFCLEAQSKIVARTDFCNYPEQAKTIKSIGGFDGRAISLEAILMCEPDFVYGFKTMHDHLVKSLEDMGIQVFLSDAKSIEEIENEIVHIGNIIGHKKQAEKLIQNMNYKLDEVCNFVKKQKSKSSKKDVKVFWQVWDNPIMTAGKDSYINDILTYCGVTNIFADEQGAYPIVNKESILNEQPDFIFYANCALIKDINAPYGFYDLTAKEEFSRSSPRVVEAIEELAKLIWNKVE